MAGRPKHQVTERLKGKVSALVSYGFNQEQVSKELGITPDTLSKYYRDELDNATLRANARVANELFKKATSGDLTAIIFWLKTRARWREKDREDDAAKDSLVQKLIDKL